MSDPQLMKQVRRVFDPPERVWYATHQHSLAHSQTPQRIMTEPNLQPDEWQQLCRLSPCGLMLLDNHAVIRFLNNAAAHLTGVEIESSIGRPLADALPAWKDSPLYASLPSFLGAQSTFESIDFDLPGADSKRLRVSAACISGASERTRGVLLAVVEDAEVASLEQRLHRAEYQASIGKLARGIAHELNSPLDGVMRYTHLALEQLVSDSPVREYLVHVKEGLDRMVRAVRAFLEFSRQVTTPVTRVADLNKLVEDALLLVHHRAKFQQIRVVKNYSENLPEVLDGGLQHAIVNLIKNGFDAMPRGGTLTITTRTSEGHVDVDVEDTGSGIPEEIASRMFEPFFSTKPIHQGNGLGLVISKEVVERSGGTIEFSSQVGAGTTFRIHVPIAPVEGRVHES